MSIYRHRGQKLDVYILAILQVRVCFPQDVERTGGVASYFLGWLFMSAVYLSRKQDAKRSVDRQANRRLCLTLCY